MTLILYKIIATLLTFLVSLITLIYPLRKLKTKHDIHHAESFELGDALASGIFLGAAFFHMLPDSTHTFNQLYPSLTYPIPEMICLIGFLLLLFLERLSFANQSLNAKETIPYVLSLILIIHSLTEGTALGISNNFTESMMLFIAIIAHKSSDSFALCIILMRYQFPLKHIIWMMIFFSLMTPLGIAIGSIINFYTQSTHGLLLAALFNAFAAGTFIYISTLHHLRFHQHLEETQGLREFAFLTLGVVMMGAIAFLF